MLMVGAQSADTRRLSSMACAIYKSVEVSELDCTAGSRMLLAQQCLNWW